MTDSLTGPQLEAAWETEANPGESFDEYCARKLVANAAEVERLKEELELRNLEIAAGRTENDRLERVATAAQKEHANAVAELARLKGPRGPRPVNPYKHEGDFARHHVWERCAAAYVAWAESGRPQESDWRELAISRLHVVADLMTVHAYQELASALEAPPRQETPPPAQPQPQRPIQTSPFRAVAQESAEPWAQPQRPRMPVDGTSSLFDEAARAYVKFRNGSTTTEHLRSWLRDLDAAFAKLVGELDAAQAKVVQLTRENGFDAARAEQAEAKLTAIGEALAFAANQAGTDLNRVGLWLYRTALAVRGVSHECDHDGTPDGIINALLEAKKGSGT